MAISQNRQPVALADICEVKRGQPLTRKETVAGDVPVIAGGQAPAYYHNRANRTGEVITVSGSGAYAGFVNFFERPIFASDCSTLQAKAENALMQYVYLAMKSRQTDIYALRLGSAQPHVYAKDVAKITIPLPPLAEQRRIVAVLNRRFAAVEKARAAALERVDAARALPAAWLREVFSFDGEGLPQGWRWEKLGDTCEINPRRPKGFGRADDKPTTFIPMDAVNATYGIVDNPQVRPYEEIKKGVHLFLGWRCSVCQNHAVHAERKTFHRQRLA